MKLIQMQYSPDAFDNFMKQKLEDVEIDVSLAEKYWDKMEDDSGGKKGGTWRNRIFYLSAFILLLTGFVGYFVYNNSLNDHPSIKEETEETTNHSVSNKTDEKGISSNTKTVATESPIKKEVSNTNTNSSDKIAIKKKDKETNVADIPKAKPAEEKINLAKEDVAISNLPAAKLEVPIVTPKKDSASRGAIAKPTTEKKKKTGVYIIW